MAISQVAKTLTLTATTLQFSEAHHRIPSTQDELHTFLRVQHINPSHSKPSSVAFLYRIKYYSSSQSKLLLI